MHSAISADQILKPLTQVRPLLTLTGFLGAGKTTLLRDILDDLSRRNILADVILNDRENAQIDRETLRDRSASVAALTGSCVCCEGLDELCRMILAAAQTSHKLLLIELNGTADPIPLQETFTLLESQFQLHPRWQVCVIDSRYFGQRSQFHELEKLQLETASHYYISQTTDDQDHREHEKRIKSINPRASRTNATQLAEALSNLITSQRSHTLPQSLQKQDSAFCPNLLPNSPRPHLHERHQVAHEFTGCNIVFPEAVEASRVLPWLEALPDSVIRAKALISLQSDLDCRFLYERVGSHISPTPIPVRSIDKIPCSGLFIGPDLQPREILELTREILHPLCHFPKK